MVSVEAGSRSCPYHRQLTSKQILWPRAKATVAGTTVIFQSRSLFTLYSDVRVR